MIKITKFIFYFALIMCAFSASASYQEAVRPVYDLARPTYVSAKKLETSFTDSKSASQIQINPEALELALRNDGLIHIDHGEGIYISIDKAAPGSPGSLVYTGSLYNKEQKKSEGEALISMYNEVLYGLIRTPHSNIQIISVGDNEKESLYVVREMAEKAVPISALSTAHESSSMIQKPAETLSPLYDYSDGSYKESTLNALANCCTIDVLVLYTAYARLNNGGDNGTQAWINATVTDLNNKISDIGLSNHTFSIKAVLPAEYPNLPSTYFENTTHNGDNACDSKACDSIVADQYWLATDPFVAALRESYDADLVVLITAADRKHPSDFAHGYAGLAEQLHGKADCYADGFPPNGRFCGEFVTIRDAYALSNLTFHHEVGHALGLLHRDGVVSFGWATNGVEVLSQGSFLQPFTIMEVGPIGGQLCTWTPIGQFGQASTSCHVRLPFFADYTKYRWMNYSGLIAPRTFGPSHQVKTKIEKGFSWLSGQR